MRLLLDEHVDKTVAAGLRTRGFDVVAVSEDARLVGVSDHAVLEHAAGGRRAVVTYDVADFRAVASERISNEEHHFGVIVLSARRFPQGKRYVGSLIEALADLLGQMPADDALVDREWWLA